VEQGKQLIMTGIRQFLRLQGYQVWQRTMALKSRWFRRIAQCMYRNLIFIHSPVRRYKNYFKNCWIRWRSMRYCYMEITITRE